MKRIPLLLVVYIFISTQTCDAQKINWLTLENAVELNKTSEKKFLIDVYTDWCGYCKKMDRETYENKTIIKYINKNFHPIKFNAEQKETITFKGETYKYIKRGRRGYHEFAAYILKGKMSYPSTVFLNNDETLLDKVPGFLPPTLMEKILVYLGEEKFKSTEWESFEKNYKSEL